MKDSIQNCIIQDLPGLEGARNCLSVLRLDLLHPVVSGNKWFKLRYYLEEAKRHQKTQIATFGGAYSNHIAAAAYAAREAGFEAIGFIRGDAGITLSPTLSQAKEQGMQLVFIDREAYRNKDAIKTAYADPQTYFINEGGYGLEGARGAATILDIEGIDDFTHIVCACGTGTMMAGLIKAAGTHQTITGISVLKNHLSLEQEVRSLLNEEDNPKSAAFIHGYHFGGYAKHPESLIRFMKEIWAKWQIPTDIVYTSKLFYAVQDLIRQQYFPQNSRILLIHSGGLQGNLSLPPNTFPF